MPPSDLEQDIARLIIESLQLEVEPAEIDPDAPLFRTGLGLDSIDALELALAISRRYSIELRADDEQNGKIFASLRALAGYIDTHRK
jgi:acyl carrier protein